MEMKNVKIAAILPSAGSGKRMGENIPKQFLKIQNKPIFVYTLEKFDSCALINEIVLVVRIEDVDVVKQLVKKWGIKKVTRVVAGGEERQDSVLNGLKALSEEIDVVVVHDAVRPFVSIKKIEEVVKIALEKDAAILAIPIKDTIKRGRDGYVEATLNRKLLWAVQTPQVFKVDLIKKAFEKAKEDGIYATDDSSLVERLGHPVYIVEGEEKNIKITSPEDLLIAETFVDKYWES